MALLALAYPTLDQVDYQWIQQIRQQYDTLYGVVAPHFTLVFPTFDRAADAFGAHVHRQVQGQLPIAVELRCAIVVKDALSAATQTFLVPDQGFSDLVKLHDTLYAGDLADQLRLDIPFIPHITVATSPDPAVCKRVADAINQQHIHIFGVLPSIDIVEHANGVVATLEQIALDAS